MSDKTIFIADLAQHGSVPDNSILTTTIHSDDRTKVTLFRFAAGQELTAHTAAHPVTLHFISGEAQIRLGDSEQTATAGSFVYMPARLEHSVKAKSELVMLLILLKNPAR
jgi:quercetin dioxygenase-like cupin family protein